MTSWLPPSDPPVPTWFLAPCGTHRAPVSVWHPSPGYIAYRHDKEGSCFIQTLVDVFTENKGPILELLTEVSSGPSLVTPPTHMPGIQWRSTPPLLFILCKISPHSASPTPSE